MRCKTLESMNFVDLSLTEDSAVAISSSVVLNFTFPETITMSDKNGGGNYSMDDSFAADSENNSGKKVVNIQVYAIPCIDG
jgi:hypothetical protein